MTGGRQCDRCAQAAKASRTCWNKRKPRCWWLVGAVLDPRCHRAMEYAGKLKRVAQGVRRQVECDAVYFEKTRTTVRLERDDQRPETSTNTQKSAAGLKKAPGGCGLTAHGMPAATEFLAPLIPQYISDLFSWAAIGAAGNDGTQTLARWPAGFRCRWGFKNATRRHGNRDYRWARRGARTV